MIKAFNMKILNAELGRDGMMNSKSSSLSEKLGELFKQNLIQMAN